MGAGAYLNFIGRGWGWALIRGWALIKFFCLLDGCFFEVGVIRGCVLIRINTVFGRKERAWQ